MEAGILNLGFLRTLESFFFFNLHLKVFLNQFQSIVLTFEKSIVKNLYKNALRSNFQKIQSLSKSCSIIICLKHSIYSTLIVGLQ